MPGERPCTVEGEGLRTQECCSRRVKDVHAHVVSVGPDTKVGIVKKVTAKVKAVAVIAARGIACGGDCHALVGRNAGACKLADDPTVSELVIRATTGIPGAAVSQGPLKPAQMVEIPTGPRTEAPVVLLNT